MAKIPALVIECVIVAVLMMAGLGMMFADKIHYYHITDTYVSYKEGVKKPGKLNPLAVNDTSENSRSKTLLISLPYRHVSAYTFQQMPLDRVPAYDFSVHMNAYWYQAGLWRIVPDDCVSAISVNDVDIPLYLPRAARCNVVNGFLFDFSPFMHNGDNSIHITVTDDQGGDYGLKMLPIRWTDNPLFAGLIAFLLVAPAWTMALRRHFSMPIVALALVSLWFGLVVFVKTDFITYSPDWWGHTEYIGYIRKHLAIPLPHSGWSLFNPPLYYAVAAVAEGIGSQVSNQPWLGVRCLALLCLLVFEFYGLRFIQDLIKDKRVRLLCSAAFLFWPLLPAMMGRVNNEVMLYAFWSMSIYYLHRWHLHLRESDLIVTLVLCGLMFLVKTSALVPAAFVGVLVLYQFLFRRRVGFVYFKEPKVMTAGILMVLCAAFNFGRTLYDKLMYEPKLGLIVGNVYKDVNYGRINTPNTLDRFVLFDFTALLREPYFSLWDDRTARQYFWISYFKSLLFGDFNWPPHDIAIGLNITFFLLVVFAVTASVITRAKNMDFVIMGLGVTVLAQMANRILIHTVVTHEARFTFPVIILFIALIGLLLQRLAGDDKQIVVRTAGEVFLSAFAILGLLFIGVFI